MSKFLLILSLFAFAKAVTAQENPFSKEAQKKAEFLSNEIKINDLVTGGLSMPSKKKKDLPLVIFIPDQGPVDRNGNQPRTKHFAYKQLSDSLVKNEIATFRYDKRTFTQVKNRTKTDSTKFGDFVNDARQVIERLCADERFSKIFLAGHGQGSLVAMLSINENINGLILLAGAGESLDDMIVGQIAKQQPGLDKVARATFDKVLSQDEPVTDIERDLYMIIGPEVQPFMKSWMQHDPAGLISDIDLPVLIVNGDMNRQMDTTQTQKLHEAAPNSQYEMIAGMNHIFKVVTRNELQASKSFVDPSFPVHPRLIQVLTDFIKQ
jgi:alpha-beta hydrolase superfamily lysophospholipase